MSTNDVPGANPVNKDVLAMGSWAEHSDPNDKSLIFVSSVEGGTVIYSMFDLNASPPLEYRDGMPEDGFKKMFTWKPGEKSGTGKNEKWIWHDKTPFPWDRVIKQGATDGVRLPSAHDTLTAAKRVADNLRLQGAKVSTDVKTRTNQVMPRMNAIKDKIGRAIAELRK